MRSRKIFCSQFEPCNGGFEYRYDTYFAPKLVSAAERDAFIANYASKVKLAQFSLFGGFVCTLSGAAYLKFSRGESHADSLVFPVFVLLAGLSYVIERSGWESPFKKTASRPASGAERSWSRSYQFVDVTQNRRLTVGLVVWATWFWVGRLIDANEYKAHEYVTIALLIAAIVFVLFDLKLPRLRNRL